MSSGGTISASEVEFRQHSSFPGSDNWLLFGVFFQCSNGIFQSNIDIDITILIIIIILR